MRWVIFVLTAVDVRRFIFGYTCRRVHKAVFGQETGSYTMVFSGAPDGADMKLHQVGLMPSHDFEDTYPTPSCAKH